MHCTIAIELTPDDVFHQANATLIELLALADAKTESLSLSGYYARQLGLAPNLQTSPPIAAIAAAADGLAADTGVWLLAVPVHLALQRDDFHLYPHIPLPMQRAESIDFQQRLNQHFASDKLTFHLGDSGHWYLHCDAPWLTDHHGKVSNPYHILGEAVGRYGPSDENWLKLQNEVQMLLFDCVENQQREAANQLAVNSVWFYGAGALPKAVSSPSFDPQTQWLSNTPFYQGLAKRLSCASEALPNTAEMFKKRLSQQSDAPMIVDLSAVEDKQSYLAACLQALKQQQLHTLVLQLGWREQVIIAQLRPLHRLRFWRKKRPFTDYLK